MADLKPVRKILNSISLVCVMAFASLMIEQELFGVDFCELVFLDLDDPVQQVFEKHDYRQNFERYGFVKRHPLPAFLTELASDQGWHLESVHQAYLFLEEQYASRQVDADDIVEEVAMLMHEAYPHAADGDHRSPIVDQQNEESFELFLKDLESNNRGILPEFADLSFEQRAQLEEQIQSLQRTSIKSKYGRTLNAESQAVFRSWPRKLVFARQSETSKKKLAQLSKSRRTLIVSELESYFREMGKSRLNAVGLVRAAENFQLPNLAMIYDVAADVYSETELSAIGWHRLDIETDIAKDLLKLIERVARLEKQGLTRADGLFAVADRYFDGDPVYAAQIIRLLRPKQYPHLNWGTIYDFGDVVRLIFREQPQDFVGIEGQLLLGLMVGIRDLRELHLTVNPPDGHGWMDQSVEIGEWVGVRLWLLDSDGQPRSVYRGMSGRDRFARDYFYGNSNLAYTVVKRVFGDNLDLDWNDVESCRRCGRAKKFSGTLLPPRTQYAVDPMRVFTYEQRKALSGYLHFLITQGRHPVKHKDDVNGLSWNRFLGIRNRQSVLFKSWLLAEIALRQYADSFELGFRSVHLEQSGDPTPEMRTLWKEEAEDSVVEFVLKSGEFPESEKLRAAIPRYNAIVSELNYRPGKAQARFGVFPNYQDLIVSVAKRLRSLGRPINVLDGEYGRPSKAMRSEMQASVRRLLVSWRTKHNRVPYREEWGIGSGKVGISLPRFFGNGRSLAERLFVKKEEARQMLVDVFGTATPPRRYRGTQTRNKEGKFKKQHSD